MILEELREKTKPYHQEIEKSLTLSKLLENCTLDDYINVLKKFYGFYLPLETKLIPEFLNTHKELKEFYFPKLKYLENDLKFFLPTLSGLEICRSFPEPENYFAQLGILYTLEGSCLGRAMLWPGLEKNLSLSKGGSFFFSGSKDLKEHWKQFCESMVSQVKDENDKNQLINGSIATFISLNKWFNI